MNPATLAIVHPGHLPTVAQRAAKPKPAKPAKPKPAKPKPAKPAPAPDDGPASPAVPAELMLDSEVRQALASTELENARLRAKLGLEERGK